MTKQSSDLAELYYQVGELFMQVGDWICSPDHKILVSEEDLLLCLRVTTMAYDSMIHQKKPFGPRKTRKGWKKGTTK